MQRNPFKRIVDLARYVGRHERSRLKLFVLQLQYGKSKLPSTTFFRSGVVIDVTDGGAFTLGEQVSFGRNATVTVKRGRLEIGKSSIVGIGGVIVVQERITIGENVLIAEYVTIRDQDHDYGQPGPTATSTFKTGPVTVGDNVWIGAKATITRGVSIGENSVIGANSVVTSDIPRDCVAAGIPARVIKKITKSGTL